MASRRPRGDTDAEVKRMYVRPAYQGRGFARQVLADLERTASAAGVGRLVLSTGIGQPEAIALYRSSGFTDIDPWGDLPAGSPEIVYLAKPIAPASDGGNEPATRRRERARDATGRSVTT